MKLSMARQMRVEMIDAVTPPLRDAAEAALPEIKWWQVWRYLWRRDSVV
ncbi:hypothetical protein [Lacticaseibacillus manihotivorans]|nr:hypothetical protein [Lacticaseibacillus manihotivorans]